MPKDITFKMGIGLGNETGSRATDRPDAISSVGGRHLLICIRATFGDLLKLHEKFRVVLGHIADDPRILDEALDVACCEDEIEMVFAVGFLQQVRGGVGMTAWSPISSAKSPARNPAVPISLLPSSLAASRSAKYSSAMSVKRGLSEGYLVSFRPEAV